MGASDTIIKTAKPIVSIIIGIVAGYAGYVYLGETDYVMPAIFGLFTMGLVFALTTEKKAHTDLINAVRVIVGLAIGICISYQFYLYIDDVTYGIIAAVIAIPICIFLTMNLDKANNN